ncbi:MAG TPA: hypothetical protein PKA33_01465 [Amaricoccus sp.]|mgnify:CR=1 FL=1|uniref:hypothetical protein n=1 Tax=Amaricoccus sp. TaxID=1872485 RepID=UPI002BFDC9DD|nr:hypothetical protein [Amaricoccus sp.]HMT98014.1 hypothetical protein [Amaricoccus sp.]
MPIYADRPSPFICVVCGSEQPKSWCDPAHVPYPPLCWSCEQYGWRRGPITRNPDQRLAKQIGALAEAISTEANQRLWRITHA